MERRMSVAVWSMDKSALPDGNARHWQPASALQVQGSWPSFTAPSPKTWRPRPPSGAWRGVIGNCADRIEDAVQIHQDNTRMMRFDEPGKPDTSRSLVNIFDRPPQAHNMSGLAA